MLVLIAAQVFGCMKDRTPQVTQLIEYIETVDQWSHGPKSKEHIEWLLRAITWDIVAVVKMAWAATDLDDPERMDELLRSGLSEAAAGPGDHVVSLVNEWRHVLGTGRYHVSIASDDDIRWMRERLTLPLPKGASPASQQAFTEYAKRASDTHDIIRIDGEGANRLLVGILGDRLVPLLRQ